MVKHVVQGLAVAALLVSAGRAVASPSDLGPARAAAGGNAFYDDFYGPFYDGYWSGAGEYFFSTGPGRPYARDDGHHFSRTIGAGFRPVEGVPRQRAGEASAAR